MIDLKLTHFVGRFFILGFFDAYVEPHFRNFTGWFGKSLKLINNIDSGSSELDVRTKLVVGLLAYFRDNNQYLTLVLYKITHWL